jgi:hypothetical protein
MAQGLKAMAEKELSGQVLSEDDQELIRSYGDYLARVVRWANDNEIPDPAAIIADVATDPNEGDVLEVGIGDVHEIYVVAPVPQADGSLALTVARGGVFSYYEFPSKTRLTDEEWREQIQSGTAIAQPAFTSGFSVPQAASTDIQASLYRFQLDWRSLLYYTGDVEFGPALSFTPQRSQAAQDTIAALRAQRQYEGRQWISTDYLSVERLDEAQAIVTVRETWQDFLVQYEGDDPFAWYRNNQPEPVAGRRGPYTIDVRYTMEYMPGVTWQVTALEELNPRPAWAAP